MDDKPESPDEILARVRREAHAFCSCLCNDAQTGDDLRPEVHECGDGKCDLSCCKETHAAIERFAMIAELKGRLEQAHVDIDDVANRLLAEIRRVGDASNK